MYIGYMGSLPFIVSSHYLRTPANYQTEAGSRWQDHDIIYHKPVSEFIGPKLRTITFDFILTASHNIAIKKDLATMKEMCENGTVFPLIIGMRPVSQNYWRLDSMSVSDTFFSSVGALIWAKVNVKLVEYDDSNYQEEKSKLNLYGSIANGILTVFR